MRWRGIAATVLLAVVGAAHGQGVPVDLALDPPETSVTWFRDAGAGARGVPVITGDFNGDGMLDVAATPFSGSTKGRVSNGFLYIVFGDGTLGDRVDVGEYEGPLLLVHGAESYSLFGVEMARADFNGDGIDDIVLGSSHGVFRDVAEAAGEAVVLLGRPEWGDTVREMDLADLPEDQPVKFLLGDNTRDRLGSWFSVRDLDANGELDMVVGMDLSNGIDGGLIDSGSTVIAWDFWTAHPEEPYIRVGDEATSDALTVVHGRNSVDLFGATNAVGDFDGNGSLDMVASAGVSRSGLFFSGPPLNYRGSGGGDGPSNNRPDVGETTIFWDAANLRQYRELTQTEPLPPDIQTTIIYGALGRYFGEDLIVGDMNGDGTDDLFAGGLTVTNPVTGVNAGGGYLFEGGQLLRGLNVLDLATPPEDYVIGFFGEEFLGIAGDTNELFDINSDGYDDLFFAIPQGSPPPNQFASRGDAGYTPVFFGGQDFPRLPEIVRTTTSPLDSSILHATIWAVDAADLFAYSSSFGDLNGDGVPEYVACSMVGDGPSNAFPEAGEYYVIDGRAIAEYAAAPMNLVVDEDALTTEPLLSWDAAQPILGDVVGYELLLTRSGVTSDTVTINRTELFRSDIEGNGLVESVRTVMDREGTISRSVEVRLDPPLDLPCQPEPIGPYIVSTPETPSFVGVERAVVQLPLIYDLCVCCSTEVTSEISLSDNSIAGIAGVEDAIVFANLELELLRAGEVTILAEGIDSGLIVDVMTVTVGEPALLAGLRGRLLDPGEAPPTDDRNGDGIADAADLVARGVDRILFP